MPEPQNVEAVMAESGIFPVSIPRLSVHTGPGTSVKPVQQSQKEIRNKNFKTEITSKYEGRDPPINSFVKGARRQQKER